jgi:hypothetical protein
LGTILVTFSEVPDVHIVELAFLLFETALKAISRRSAKFDRYSTSYRWLLLKQKTKKIFFFFCPLSVD